MDRAIRVFVTALIFSVWLPSVYAGPDIVGCQGQCRKTITWTGCEISKKGFMTELADTYGKKHNLTFILSGGGATKGIRDVVKGDVNMGGMCRLPLLFESAAIAGETEGVKEESGSLLVPVGWDALVVVTHKDNPVTDVSIKELKKILKGEITDWSQLKKSQKKTGKFNLYLRKGRISGVGRTLRQTLFDNVLEDFTEGAKIMKSSGLIEEALMKDVDGIAVTGYSSATKRKGLKMLSLSGRASTMENLEKGKYPIYRLLILTVMKESLQDPDVSDFVLYARSREAAKIIRSAGTLPFMSGMNLTSKLKDSYLMEIFDLEAQGRYNPSKFDLEKWSIVKKNHKG